MELVGPVDVMEDLGGSTHPFTGVTSKDARLAVLPLNKLFLFLLCWLHQYDEPIISKVKSNQIAISSNLVFNHFIHHNVSDDLCPQSRDFVHILSHTEHRRESPSAFT